MAQKGATGDSFFHFCKKKIFFLKMDNIFMENKKKVEKKKNCGRPTGFNYSHPLDRKQIFFYGQPNGKSMPNILTLDEENVKQVIQFTEGKYSK